MAEDGGDDTLADQQTPPADDGDNEHNEAEDTPSRGGLLLHSGDAGAKAGGLNLAARRAAPQLPKLRDLIRRCRQDCSVDEALCGGAAGAEPDLEFDYADADSLGAEMAELYAYGEADQVFVGNATAWKAFAKRKQIRPCEWRKLCLEHRRSLLLGLIEELELVDRQRRMDAVRVILYLLQGCCLDHSPGASAAMASSSCGAGDDVIGRQKDAAALLASVVDNVYLLTDVGVFQALCTVLAVETKGDDAGGATELQQPPPQTQHEEAARRRSCSLADNLDLRLILSAMYCFVEVLRRPLAQLPEAVLRKRSPAERQKMERTRADFREELGAICEYGGGSGVPLAVVLFEMVKQFCAGDAPHLPMRKTLLLLWKTLLFWLGGFDELREKKAAKRAAAGLDDAAYFEDTIVVSKRMRAAPPPTMPPLAAAMHMNEGGGGGRRARPPMARRQMACSGERADGEDDADAGLPDSAADDDEEDAKDAATGGGGAGSAPGGGLKRGFPGDAKDEATSDEDDEDEVMIDLSSNAGTSSADGNTDKAKEQPCRPDSPTPTNVTSRGGRDSTSATRLLLERTLPWRPKIRTTDVTAFIDQERQKFLHYRLPDDATTLFGLPRPIHESVRTLNKHVYVSLGERQAARDEQLSRYYLSQTDAAEGGGDAADAAERLYAAILPSIPQYMIALLKILLAAAPSSKAKTDAMNILCDVLPAGSHYVSTSGSSFSLDAQGAAQGAAAAQGDPLEQSVLTGIDINRHKEVMVKAVSSILILLLKHLRLSHVYQFEYLAQHLVFANCIPLILKFFDQKIHQYVQPGVGAANELPALNYPAAALFLARHGHLDWQRGGVDDGSGGGMAGGGIDSAEKATDDTRRPSHSPPPPPAQLNFQWRNLYSAINLLRVLNKLTKWKHARTMMLVVFKSAPILKRTLRIKQILLQLFALKLLKMQAKYLGRQWRKTNMEIMSAIYSKVRHRMNDDWAYGNETQSKPWDFQAEESSLKAAVERFNVRRYLRRHAGASAALSTDGGGASAIQQYIFNDPEFEPYDNDAVSLLGKSVQLTDRFKLNYEKWLEMEVFRASINWDLLLQMNRGVYANAVSTTSAVTDASG